jgi:hypothetical protein
MISERIISIFFITSTLIFAQVRTENGSDPTEIRTRVDLQLVQLTGLGGGDFMGTTISGEYAFTRKFAAGLDVPWVYTTVDGFAETGIGDIRIMTIYNLVYDDSGDQFFEALSGGINLYLDTGNAQRGTGIDQSLIAPYLALSYALAEQLRVAPVLRQYISLSKGVDNLQINEMHLMIDGIAIFEHGIWIKITPEAVIDFEGDRIPTYNLRSSLGKMLDENWGIVAEFTSNLAGDPRVDYTSNLTLQYLFD